MRRVMLIYPPGKLYQRGEDRSQGNIEDSTATSVRAANDLGYASTALKDRGHEVFLRDYQTERLPLEALRRDFVQFAPSLLFLSVTNTTIFEDLKIVAELKKLDPKLRTILKGAIFFDPEDDLLAQLDLEPVDYLVGGEVEFVIADIADHAAGKDVAIEKVPGVLYRDSTGAWIKTDFSSWEPDLAKLRFPDRSAMNNALYRRPDTGEPQATIATSRGCAASCIYCLTPRISGKRVRLRDPDDIVAELVDCYRSHGIRNFFFKSDTFTINHRWVKDLSERIQSSELRGKIEWVANSRVNPLRPETLGLMRDAGCWLVAFGFESGHPETLRLIKKGATVEENLRAARWTREAGLKCFGFYLIGLPWESEEHIAATRNLIFEQEPDFMELHIAVPYYGTELYSVAQEYAVIDGSPLGKDYFNSPTRGTLHLSGAELQRIRSTILFRYHARPRYLARRMKDCLTNPRVFANYARFGLRLVSRTLRPT